MFQRALVGKPVLMFLNSSKRSKNEKSFVSSDRLTRISRPRRIVSLPRGPARCRSGGSPLRIPNYANVVVRHPMPLLYLRGADPGVNRIVN